VAPVGAEARSDRPDCRRLARLAAKGLLLPVRVPTGQEEADRRALRRRELLVRKARAVQSRSRGFLLQYGVVEPAGPVHWTKASVAERCGFALPPELRFCLDLPLDGLAHAREQVRRVTAGLRGLADADRHRKATAVPCAVPEWACSRRRPRAWSCPGPSGSTTAAG
jgi:transposase